MSNYDKVCQDNLQSFFKKIFVKHCKMYRDHNLVMTLDLENQTSIINSISSLMFFFKWPLVALNEVKEYTPAKLNNTPEENRQDTSEGHPQRMQFTILPLNHVKR